MNYLTDRRTVREQLETMPFVNQLAWIETYLGEDFQRRSQNRYLMAWVKKNGAAMLALYAHTERNV